MDFQDIYEGYCRSNIEPKAGRMDNVADHISVLSSDAENAEHPDHISILSSDADGITEPDNSTALTVLLPQSSVADTAYATELWLDSHIQIPVQVAIHNPTWDQMIVDRSPPRRHERVTSQVENPYWITNKNAPSAAMSIMDRMTSAQTRVLSQQQPHSHVPTTLTKDGCPTNKGVLGTETGNKITVHTNM